MQTDENPLKSFETLEKIYLKDKYPRSPDPNFNHLNLKAKDLKKASELSEASKKLETNELEIFENFELLQNSDTTISQNYESLSLINGAKIAENEEIKEDDLVSNRYASPLKKLKDRFLLLKYGSLVFNGIILIYLGYHLLNLLKLKAFIGEVKQDLNEYYKKNSDNLVFSNTNITIILYLIGVCLYFYGEFVHFQMAIHNIKFFENDYIINHKIKENCKKARIFCLVFAVVFCIGNIFQIASYNYSTEFENLANSNSNTNNENNVNKTDDEGPQIMASWRVYFYVLVIGAIMIKVSLWFLNVALWHCLEKVKFEYSKMCFEIHNNILSLINV